MESSINDEKISDVLARYGLRLVGVPAALSAGTLNDNYLVQTQHGARVLRRIRDDQPDENVRLEHETISWVHQQALPVTLPITPNLLDEPQDDDLPTTCIRLGSGRWVLFDFVSGESPRRSQLSTVQASALGDIHGRLHRALVNHPRSKAATFTMRWSAEQSDMVLQQSHAAAKKANAPSAVLDAIDLQRSLLSATNIRAPEDFARLPCQWLHGDFHAAQVLLNEDHSVAAVLDWELCQSGARVWELVRSLAFSGLLEQPALEDYLIAYCRHVDLHEDEVALGMELWWQSRIVGGWVWWAGYVRGNTRVLDVLPDTIDTLNNLAKPGWTESITQRVLDLLKAARVPPTAGHPLYNG